MLRYWTSSLISVYTVCFSLDTNCIFLIHCCMLNPPPPPGLKNFKTIIKHFMVDFNWYHFSSLLKTLSLMMMILWNLSHLMTKPIKWSVCPAKTQISLGICPVWSESSQYAQWVAEDPMCLHADSEDSDQTGRMPRLIWVFDGRTDHFAGFVELQLISVISGE